MQAFRNNFFNERLIFSKSVNLNCAQPTSALTYPLTYQWLLLRAPFLCLLHINFWVMIGLLMLLKAKCDHFHHVCTDGFAPWWWKWSRRAFSLLTAYQILSADFIAKGAWQSCISKLQYHNCRRRNITTSFDWPHGYHLLLWTWPHIGMILGSLA